MNECKAHLLVSRILIAPFLLFIPVCDIAEPTQKKLFCAPRPTKKKLHTNTPQAAIICSKYIRHCEKVEDENKTKMIPVSSRFFSLVFGKKNTLFRSNLLRHQPITALKGNPVAGAATCHRFFSSMYTLEPTFGFTATYKSAIHLVSKKKFAGFT